MKKPTPKKKQAKQKLRKDYIECRILDPKPNPLFPDWMTKLIKFIRFNRPHACAYCLKKERTLWTMLCEFKVVDVEKCLLVAIPEPTRYPPLTPVCMDHPMHPDIFEP